MKNSRTQAEKNYQRNYQRVYRSRPDIKAKMKAYQVEYRKRPGVREAQNANQRLSYLKNNGQTTARKEYLKEYNRRPDVKERQKLYGKKYNQIHKKRISEYRKAYRLKKKEALKKSVNPINPIKKDLLMGGFGQRMFGS